MLGRLRLRSHLRLEDEEALVALPHRLSALDPGTYIVREGDRAEECCVLLSGFVYRHKVVADGARQILSVHFDGDVIDLQNSLLRRADHSIQALTRAQVALVPRQAILDLCERRPAIAHALWVETLVDASISREWIANVGRRSARQRIAHLLCELALRQESIGLCRRPSCLWPMTQEQVGDATGLTSVHVNRILQGLRADRLISTAKRTVTILDRTDLQDEGDFDPAYLHLARKIARVETKGQDPHYGLAMADHY